jgi:hypothetical protein
MLKESTVSHKFNVEDMEAGERNSIYVKELSMGECTQKVMATVV